MMRRFRFSFMIKCNQQHFLFQIFYIINVVKTTSFFPDLIRKYDKICFDRYFEQKIHHGGLEGIRINAGSCHLHYCLDYLPYHRLNHCPYHQDPDRPLYLCSSFLLIQDKICINVSAADYSLVHDDRA